MREGGARIAQDDWHIRPAFRQEMKQLTVAGDTNNRRVDFIIMHSVSWLGAADQTAGTEANDCVADWTGGLCADRVHYLGHRRAVIIIHMEFWSTADRFTV